MFTKQHYEPIAKIIKQLYTHSDADSWSVAVCNDLHKLTVNAFVILFAKDNSYFNAKEFIKACGVSDN